MKFFVQLTRYARLFRYFNRRQPAPPSASKCGATVIIHGSVGAVQTGLGATAHVVRSCLFSACPMGMAHRQPRQRIVWFLERTVQGGPLESAGDDRDPDRGSGGRAPTGGAADERRGTEVTGKGRPGPQRGAGPHAAGT